MCPIAVVKASKKDEVKLTPHGKGSGVGEWAFWVAFVKGRGDLNNASRGDLADGKAAWEGEDEGDGSGRGGEGDMGLADYMSD